MGNKSKINLTVEGKQINRNRKHVYERATKLNVNSLKDY